MIEGKKKVIFLSLCILPLGLDFCRSVCSTKLGHFWKRWICWVRNQRGLGACEMSRFCLKISSNSVYRTPTHFVSLLGLKTIWDNFAMLSVQTYRQISWPVFPSDGRRGRFSRAQSCAWQWRRPSAHVTKGRSRRTVTPACCVSRGGEPFDIAQSC